KAVERHTELCVLRGIARGAPAPTIWPLRPNTLGSSGNERSSSAPSTTCRHTRQYRSSRHGRRHYWQQAKIEKWRRSRPGIERLAAFRAASKEVRAGQVSLFARQQGHLQQCFAMIRLKIKGFAITLRGAWFAFGLPHQTQEVIRSCRGAVFA